MVRMSILLGKQKKILFILLFIYIIAFAIHGTSRFLVKHEQVIKNIDNSYGPWPEGYGHLHVLYFNKIFLVKPYEPLNTRDFLTFAFLLLTGITSLITYIIIKNIPNKLKHKSLWLIFSIGFIYLGLDEILQFHEFIGLNLSYLFYKNYPLEVKIDKDFNGVIVLLYAVLGLLVFTIKFNFFKKSKLGLLLLMIGFATQGLAAIIDYFWDRLYILEEVLGPLKFLVYRDELFEMTASFLFFAAFILYSMEYLSEYYEVRDGFYTPKPLNDS